MNQRLYLVDDSASHLLIAGGTIAIALYLVPAGISLAGSIARERQRRTLDDLLSIPWDRRQILVAKLEAIIRTNWGFAPAAAVAIAAGFWADGTFWNGLAALELVYASVWLIIGLGALLTIRLPNPVLSFRFLLPIIVIAIGAAIGLSNLRDTMGRKWMRDAVPGIAVVFAAAGIVCWRKACRDLDALG